MNDLKPVISTEENWPVRTVGEMVSLLRRGTAPAYVDESDIFAIGQRCVTDSDFDGSRARAHSPTTTTKVLPPQDGDILINSTGTGTIGRSVVFHEDGQKYIIDGHVTVARPRDSELVGRWLNDTLRSPAGQRYLEARCYAGSTNQIELSASALASMPIAVPPIAEQRRAAEMLDALDDQIRLTRGLLAKLLAMRSGLADDLLTGRVRVPEGGA